MVTDNKKIACDNGMRYRTLEDSLGFLSKSILNLKRICAYYDIRINKNFQKSLKKELLGRKEDFSRKYQVFNSIEKTFGIEPNCSFTHNVTKSFWDTYTDLMKISTNQAIRV